MQATLIVVGGVHNGKKIPLTVADFLIGRDATCHLRPNSKDVELQHCVLRARDDLLYLHDGGRGTRCNGRWLIGGELQLLDGDKLQIGPLTFQLALTTPVVPAQPKLDTDSLLVVEDQDTGLRPAVGQPSTKASAEETAVIPAPPPVKTDKHLDSHEVLCLS